MNPKLCPGRAKSISITNVTESMRQSFWDMSLYESHDNPYCFRGVKRIRMTCELCGARVLSSVKNNDPDSLDPIHILPPHKPKGWWKKKN